VKTLMNIAAFMCALAFQPAQAKSADDYFHGASSLYVAGKIQEASVEAEDGLRLNPGDAKLRMLAEHLRKMKDNQRPDKNKGDGKDNKDQKDPKNPDDSKDPNKNPKNSDKQDPNKKGDGKEDDKDKQPPKPGDENGKDKDDKNKGDGKQAPQPNRMSEEEAKRLLNSFADDEKKEQAERRKAVRQRAGTEQDW
jgi:Ca-activated chloride channel family protein